MHTDALDVDSHQKRQILWTVLCLNVGIAAGFIVTGFIADSNSLLANGIDNASDAIVYALSLFALSHSRKWKRGAARFSSIMLFIFAAGVIADAVRRYFEGSEPIGPIMMGMAVVAGVINLLCLYLLNKLQSKDVNLRAATTFSFNDFFSNGGVILAGIAVMLFDTNWPDLAVGIATAGIALYGGYEILRDAHMDTHDEAGTQHRKGD